MTRSRPATVNGPLAPYAAGFAEELVGLGYARRSVETHLYLMSQLSRWLEESGLTPGELGSEQMVEFLKANRATGRRFPRSADGLKPLLGYLRRVDVAFPLVAPARTAGEELVERFGAYLARERGLAAGTIVGYQHAARLFLASLEARGRELGTVSPADLNEFLVAAVPERSVASCKCLVTGLRALLRFLQAEGVTAVPLAEAVPAVAGWGGGPLPRGIDARSVQCLLDSCDRRTSKGRRDFAVLMLLCRLGMRAGEVTALELRDLDWRAGEVVVRGKGPRLERLPLPVDVGEALSGYVRRSRPRSEHPQVFLRLLAPHTRLTVGAISVIVHAACQRGSLPPVGTHRLRHSVATELLRQGAGLPEIGQLLRHRSIAVTSIYAKVDTIALHQLARPWPVIAP